MIAQQDGQLDRITGVVEQIRFENQNFGTEVKLQNKMLDKVNQEIEENTDNMVKLDNKLKVLLAKTSICKLWIIIILELVLTFFLLTSLF